MKKTKLALLLAFLPLSSFAFTCPEKGQKQTSFKLKNGEVTVCSDESPKKGKLVAFFETTKVYATPTSKDNDPSELKIQGFLDYPTYEFSKDKLGNVVFVKEVKNVLGRPVPFFASEIKCEKDKCFQTPAQCVVVQKLNSKEKKKFKSVLNKIRNKKSTEPIKEPEMTALGDYALMGEKEALEYYSPNAPDLNKDGATGESYTETKNLIKKLKELNCFKQN